MAPQNGETQFSKSPTAAQVRKGKHARRPGEPVDDNEPAASPLGADDEAAGRSAEARRLESAMRSDPDPEGKARTFMESGWMPVVGLLGFAAFLALLIAALLIS